MKNQLLQLSALLLSSILAAPAQAAPAARSMTSGAVVRLPGHLGPAALRGAVLVGRKSGTETVPLTFTLPLRDPDGLSRLLARQYTPGDPLFHKFISPVEFSNRFGPTPQAYAAAMAFARTHGLRVTGTHTSRLLLDVAGPASAVEAAFGVHLQNYRAADGRIFHSPDAGPAIPASLGGRISGVVGLQNAAVWQTHLRRQAPFALVPRLGTGADGGLTPSDIKAAYALDQTPLNGSGRTLGLFELASYTPSDITAYENTYKLPQVPLSDILVNGAVDVPTGDGPGEVTLDIELMAALAPGASKILVYEAPNDGPSVLDCYGQIADDNRAKEISTSWGSPESQNDQVFLDAENAIFRQMASQGQSIYSAAGDYGAYDDYANLSVDDPSAQPFMVAVGGTSLNVITAGGAYQAETTWGDPTPTPISSFGTGGGGGISSVWPVPDYQSTVTTLGSATKRNLPDVSLDADPNTGYSIYLDGQFVTIGGTSAAAPLWAAYTALVNQQRALNGEADLGFPNPTLYGIGLGASYRTGFHDIADGSTNLYYHATPGYDNATGWGSFNGAGLLPLLAPAVVAAANPVASLTLSPASVVGGLSAQSTVTLTNPAPDGGASVTLSSSGSIAGVPATVVVAAGSSRATFPVQTQAVTAAASAKITAAYAGGSRDATLAITPAPAVIVPASLTLNPASVGGGQSSVATVTLSGPAPTGGLSVALSSSVPATATVPATVAVAAGAVSANFPVTTLAVTKQVLVTLSTSVNGAAQTATLTVDAPALERIALLPTSVIGGDTATLTLTLTYPAPVGGAAIKLTSDSSAAVLPASVTIPAGQMSATAPITTPSVSATVVVNLTASYSSVTKKAALTVSAVLPVGLTLTPVTVIGGASTVGTFTLASPAPAAGLSVSLTSSDPAATPPAALTLAPGATSASFILPTLNVPAAVTAKITATLNGAPETAALSIQPVQLTALTLTPAAVALGTASTGRLTLNAPAPAGGLSVALSSSTAAGSVPATVLVPAGSQTVTFTTGTPHAGKTVITAALGAAVQTASLTISGAPGTTYPAGLNMISAPYDYPGVPLDGLFGYTGVLLGTWQPTTGAYALTSAAPAEALHLGRGYWVNLPAATTLSSSGAPADPSQDYTIALSPGWNQIGQPWPASETLSSLTVTGGGAAVSFDQATTSVPLLVSSLVYRYAPKQGTTPGAYAWVRSGETLQPGLGYWVYAYQAVTLTVPRH